MFRAVDRPASVHKSFRSGLVLGSLSGSPPATISGRLANLVLLGDQDKTSHQPTPHTLPLPRHSDKRGEIRPLPVQVRRIPRHDHRHGISPSVPHRDSNTEIPLLSKEVPIPTEPPGPAVAGVVGTHVIIGEAGTLRKTLDALPPVASEVQLVHRERPPTPSGTLVPAGGQGHLVVDGKKPPTRGDALRGTPPPPTHTHTQNSAYTRTRHLVRPGDLTPHQHPGDESSVPGTLDLPGHGLQPASDSNVQQLHGGSLCQQAGGDSLRLPLRVDRATSPLDGSPQRTPGSEIPPGTIERPRGSPQPPQPSTSCGVVPAPTDSEDDHPHLGVPDDRPIRNTPQCEASPVLLPDSRPSSRLRRRLPPPVEQPRRVRVPTLPFGREGGGQSQRDPRSLHDSDHPPLAEEVLVRRPPPPADPTSSDTTSVGPPLTPTPLPSVPRPEPSRLETVKCIFRKSGLSRRASRQLSRCVRESTARLYKSQWLSFCGWCRGRSVTPIDATIPMIVDFLIHLREDKGFSLSALKGYRSTINSVFTLKGMDLANSKELSMLFRSFAKTCSPQDLRPPAWDVALVLQSLTNQPYEPIREAEERFLAQKTLFLIALASAKRVGELHTLSYRVSYATDWKLSSFSFVPGFVAKTQDQSSFDPRFKNFTVPALPKSSSSPNGRLLCPVRAVKRYLDRTAQHRPQCERLFIASGRTKKEISKNTVSFWLRKVISLAYQLSGKPLPSRSPLARETRGIAPSLLFKKNYAVSQVLKTGTWRRHTTFTCHYLRDLSHKSLDTFHLGPVVVAQATV